MSRYTKAKELISRLESLFTTRSEKNIVWYGSHLESFISRKNEITCKCYFHMLYWSHRREADVAKLVDALDLGSSEQPSWEFESLRPQVINKIE